MLLVLLFIFYCLCDFIAVSKRGQPNKTSTPKPTMNSSRSTSRPKSMASSISGSRSRPVDQELEVHMTEFGMRRVKTDLEGHSFGMHVLVSFNLNSMNDQIWLFCRKCIEVYTKERVMCQCLFGF